MENYVLQIAVYFSMRSTLDIVRLFIIACSVRLFIIAKCSSKSFEGKELFKAVAISKNLLF